LSISVNNLSFSYGRHAVLKGLSFDAADGELIAILGSNGAGKSTLFRCILGSLNKYTGSILLDGTDARSLSPRETAHRVACIPQSAGAGFEYTVRDMVLMGTAHSLSLFAQPGAAENEAADRAMEQIGISALAEKVFSHLSGGEQQLVLAARALAQGSKTLLMDEPTASLDYGNQALVMQTARDLADRGYCVMLSTHSPQQALWYADRVLAILDGGIAAWGRPSEVMDETLVRRLYGIEVRFVESENGVLICPIAQK